ncbi:MAG: type II toxin-antitoxin system VapC family toxin [Niveispirillum sp.]|uniref:type II toxin-antitoxin system VapC family toxin n=1 Tax=Niveispirillum sp. TaxID=1917217 RepID=UPI003BA4DA06
MILLDTNVISEPFRTTASPAVLAWLDAQLAETLYLSTITLAEIRFGIAALPDGKRRSVLKQRFEERILPAFADRILSFDMAATISYAAIRTRAKAAGLAIGVADGYIAAIAAARGLAVATRDDGPFRAAGLTVINPWVPAGNPS